MEEIIKKIISIDKDAEKYREINNEMLSKKKSELEIQIKTIIQEGNADIENEKKNIVNIIMQDARIQVRDINMKRQDRLKKIMNSFNNVKSKIEEEAFEKLVKSFEEV